MNSDSQSNNKRIAKNTLMLYIRMMFMMLIGLYTSRVILDKLGEVDFGIYNVVGGFVTMFSIISGAMTSATQRFLSFEIGKKDKGNVKGIFSTMVYIHMFLAFIILLLGETVGVWFINNKMNFPAERYTAANWVFQFSLFTFILNVINVPYNGAIIAYEKMSAFAYFSIFDAIMKLLICYVIVMTAIDKLVMYALLMAIIQVLLIGIYFVYCRRNFSQCKLENTFNRSYGREVFSFVSWNLIGSVAMIAKEQGVNVVLNIFFGPAVNAARGIAHNVLTKVNGFVTNFQTAMNPQIIKNYASGDREAMFKLVFRGAKLSYLLLLTLSLPVIIEAPFILNIWLKAVPDYTVIFLRLVLLTSMLSSLSNPLIITMHASGRVKEYQIVVGGVSLLTLPLVYVGFKYFTFAPYWAMIIVFAIELICHIVRLYMLKRMIGFPIGGFLKSVTIRVFIITILSFIVPIAIYQNLDDTIIRFVFVCIASIFATFIFGYYLGLCRDERAKIKQNVYNLVFKKSYIKE